MVRLLVQSIEACADGVRTHDLRDIADVLIERLFVFECRVRHSHRHEVVDLEIRNASGPWQRTLIRTWDLQRIQAIFFLKLIREEKLVRTDISESGINDHSRTRYIVNGAGH